MKLKEHLKAKGWTDEQINAALADTNLVSTLDDIFGTVTSERDQLKARDAEWERKLAEEYQPAITKAEQKAIEEGRRAADLEFQVKAAKEYGYLPEDKVKEAEAAAAAARPDPNGFDPKKYVNWDDAHRMLDGEGEAIALSHDLAMEYHDLTGQSLLNYETVVNGQTMRGMRALRQEAKAKRMNLDAFVSEKFDFPAKRQALREKAQQEHDDKIRKEAAEAARREMAEKYGNPNMATAQPSRQPFIPTRPTDGKQPWERTAQERKAGRIQRAMQAESGVVQ